MKFSAVESPTLSVRIRGQNKFQNHCGYALEKCWQFWTSLKEFTVLSFLHSPAMWGKHSIFCHLILGKKAQKEQNQA